MEELMNIENYASFKNKLDTEIRNVAEGFVRTGYLLKVARDTNILEESGYKSVAEFAQAEYGLTKDIVSRYIAINDRYSEGGYSEHLLSKYEGYGVAKLSEMLTLPDSVIESMDPQLTRREIQEVKKEIKEEEQMTELEVMMEEKNPVVQQMDNLLSKVLYQYCHENRQEYKRLWEAMGESGDRENSIERILDVMAPSGIKMIMTRISGLGKVMMSIRGKDNSIELVNVRSGEKEVVTWETLIDGMNWICEGNGPEEQWERLYGEQFEEPKEEQKKSDSVAQVQQNEQQEEKQTQGQMQVEDYPEILPRENEVEKIPESQTEVIETREEVINKQDEKGMEVAQVQQNEQQEENITQQNGNKVKELVTKTLAFVIRKDYVTARAVVKELDKMLDEIVNEELN